MRVGRPVQVVDPATGLPFPGNVIPRERISPQAAALLGYYPRPNRGLAGAASTIRRRSCRRAAGQRPDAPHAVVNQRNQLFGTVAYQRRTTRRDDRVRLRRRDRGVGHRRRGQLVAPLLAVPAAAHALSVHATGHRRSRRTSRTGPTCRATPASPATIRSRSTGARRRWRSRAAGGPHRRAASRHTTSLTHAAGVEAYSVPRAATTSRFGGDVRRHQIDVLSQQDPRGSVHVHRRGDRLRLRRLPARPAADQLDRLRQRRQVLPRHSRTTPTSPTTGASSPSFTLTAGVRWEYEAPITERFGRLVNLDVAPGFTAVQPVLASRPDRARSPAETYPDSLLAPGQARHPAAARHRVAAGARIVAGRPRRLRHLPQHQRLSVDRDAAGAAAAAVDGVQRREHARAIR